MKKLKCMHYKEFKMGQASLKLTLHKSIYHNKIAKICTRIQSR